MRRAGRCAIQSLAALAVAGLLATGCGLFEPSSPAPSFVAAFAGPEGLVGLTRSNGAIALYIPNGAGGTTEITTTPDRPGDLTVHLAALGGSTQARLNSFVYGNAPAGAATVEVTPETVVGQVQNGLFVVGLQQKDLNPLLLHWKFLRLDGTVVLSGSGIKE
jgi:hypothetical protein